MRPSGAEQAYRFSLGTIVAIKVWKIAEKAKTNTRGNSRDKNRILVTLFESFDLVMFHCLDSPIRWIYSYVRLHVNNLISLLQLTFSFQQMYILSHGKLASPPPLIPFIKFYRFCYKEECCYLIYLWTER